MGQVLPVFAHCKEAPSTASSTPDSTDGGNEDSDFRELHTAREFSEEEEEETTSQDWGTPRELTFSYIAFEAGGSRRDSVPRRPRPSGRSESREQGPSGLGDSLESIPSLSQSPEPERRVAQEGPPQAELRLRLDQLAWESGQAASGESASSPSEEDEDENEEEEGGPEPRLAGEDLEVPHPAVEPSLPEVCWPHLRPGPGTPDLQDHTPSPPLSLGSRDSNSWREEEEPEEEGEVWGAVEREPITGPHLDSSDQSGITLEIHILVAELLYWRDTRTSGVVFTGIMISLLCLLHFSIVSVASHVALAVLAVTISLRVYHKALQAVHRGDGANPFQAYLDVDLSLSREQTARYTEQITAQVVSGVTLMRHLFLVEDLVDSLKLALLFYILTFVGAVFNGLTLLILGVISAFTFPLLYRQHQVRRGPTTPTPCPRASRQMEQAHPLPEQHSSPPSRGAVDLFKDPRDWGLRKFQSQSRMSPSSGRPGTRLPTAPRAEKTMDGRVYTGTELDISWERWAGLAPIFGGGAGGGGSLLGGFPGAGQREEEENLRVRGRGNGGGVGREERFSSAFSAPALRAAAAGYR
ncbi:reticulon-2 [Gracilinanus agilis]|uniref:reticulon-2 n=1 Tax=Gracilinanus agilis TaxID=191870 RepID=UPI001CFEFC58|nr:reticulon-2 [Gracilinanus agilis]